AVDGAARQARRVAAGAGCRSFLPRAGARRTNGCRRAKGNAGYACRLDPVGDLRARLSAETIRGAGVRLRRLDLAVARRSVGHERVEQFMRGLRHLLHRAAERGFVCFGGPRESAQLADELQRGRAGGGGGGFLRRWGGAGIYAACECFDTWDILDPMRVVSRYDRQGPSRLTTTEPCPCPRRSRISTDTSLA